MFECNDKRRKTPRLRQNISCIYKLLFSLITIIPSSIKINSQLRFSLIRSKDYHLFTKSLLNSRARISNIKFDFFKPWKKYCKTIYACFSLPRYECSSDINNICFILSRVSNVRFSFSF